MRRYRWIAALASLSLVMLGSVNASADPSDPELRVYVYLDNAFAPVGTCVDAIPEGATSPTATECMTNPRIGAIFPTLPAGRYVLHTKVAGHLDTWTGVPDSVYRLQDAVATTVGPNTTDVLHATSGGVIVASIRDAVTGDPVKDFDTCVGAVSTSGVRFDDMCSPLDNGALPTRTIVVPPGDYRLAFHYDVQDDNNRVSSRQRDRQSYAAQWAPGGVYDGSLGAVVTAPADQITTADIALVKGASVSGTLTNSTGGPSQGCVRVTTAITTERAEPIERQSDPAARPADEIGRTCTVDVHGTYTVRGLPPGPVTVSFYNGSRTHPTSTVDLDPTEGQDITGVDAVLDPGGGILGRLRGPEDDWDIPLTQVLAYPTPNPSGPEDAVASSFTANQASFGLGPLDPGTYYVEYVSGHVHQWHGGPTSSDATPVVVGQDDVTLPDDIIDLSPPDTITVIDAGHATTLDRSALVTWKSTDHGTGTASYDVRYRRISATGAASPYGSLRQATTSTSLRLNLAPGNTYCTSVRARDKVGNTSAYTADTCTSRPLDDTALKASPSWTRGRNAVFYGGTILATKADAATVTYGRAQVSRIAVLADTCPSCGVLTVFVGGTVIGQVNLTSASTKRRQVLTLPTFSLRTGVIKLAVASRGRTVHLDGLLLSRV